MPQEDRESVAETLPDAIRVQLEQMREQAEPYVDRIVAEFAANPTTVLDRLPAVRTALALDEETRLALLAAVLERHLDSSDEMWHSLTWMVYRDTVRRDTVMAQWLQDHAVISRLLEIVGERAQEDFGKRMAEQEAPATRPLPPRMDERLERHRLAAEPWLRRIGSMEDAVAGIQHPKKILADLAQEPAELRVSVALAWLYEALNEVPRSRVPGIDLRWWRGINRPALPYEADDLELALGLLEGHKYDWIYGQQIVRAIERYSANAGPIPDRWHDQLRALLAEVAGSRQAEYQKLAQVIRSLLGGGAEPSSRLDVSPIDGRDAWSSTVRELLSERFGEDGSLNRLIAMLQDSGTGPRPSATWRKGIDETLGASESALEVVRLLLETAIEVRDDLVQRTADGNWLSSTLGAPAALQIRAAAWAARLSGADWAPELLERLAGRYAEMLFQGEPFSARVVNGTVSALASGGDRDAVGRLVRLQRSLWHGSMRKHLERELDSLAAAVDLTRGQLLELSAPNLGLGDDGSSTLAVGATGSLTLSLDDRCQIVPAWSVTGSSTRSASPPAALRSAEPQRVKELQLLVKQARASLAAERDRVDGLLAEQPRWPLSDWLASYVGHPVLRALGGALVWNVHAGDDVRAGMPGTDQGTFFDVDGLTFAAPDDALITLWHPIAASDEEIAGWRSAVFERRLVQPVRQVFREVYRLAPEERGLRHSTRFAGQLVKQQPLRGLLKRRGWSSPALLPWVDAGADIAVAKRLFHGFGVRAELRYAAAWMEDVLDGLPGGFPLVATDQLRFFSAGTKDSEALPLEDVPALVVSEAMRDVDLCVSVCSVGLDPAWRDVGDTDLQLQWRELAFGELVESARIRRDVLERALPQLSIADRCTVYDRDLVVRGTRGTYRIHIGTGQVRADPHGLPLVLPRARAGSGELRRLFLPVEADDTLAAVLDSAFVLANDDAISDETLLSQLRALGD